jgi:hypothetical protein
MYERMLNKQKIPTLDEIYKTMGTEKVLFFEELQNFLVGCYELNTELKFPFGNNYGWGYKYSHKSKHLCYVFFEKDAFTVTIQIGKNELTKLYNKLESLSPKAKDMWEHRYPCGDGGWLHYRILNEKDLEDIKEFIIIKKTPIAN